MIYRIIFNIHLVVSLITLLAGFSIVIHSFTGWLKKREYGKRSFRVSLILLISLYTQFLFGSLIYIMLRSPEGHPLSVTPVPDNDQKLRFWAIIHISWMIVALLLTQVGRIYIRHSTSSVKKHKASLFYYGTALFLILLSLGFAILNQ
jgi:hypothetical protein